jgi:hypothetical protein
VGVFEEKRRAGERGKVKKPSRFAKFEGMVGLSLLCWQFFLTTHVYKSIFLNSPHTMPPKKPPVPVTPSIIATRPTNKETHPGAAEAGAKRTRRTSAEVQAEREAKAKAKAKKAATKKKNIKRAAEYEHNDMLNEDLVDATPRPSFTSKTQPRSKASELSAIAEATDDSDGAMLIDGNKSATGRESEDELTDPPPPPKKLKAQTRTTARAPAKPAHANPKPQSKAAVHAREIRPDSDRDASQASDEDLVAGSDEDHLGATSKKGRSTVKVRDQINIAAKTIEKGKSRKKADTARSTTEEAEDEEPAPKPSSQGQVKRWVLKREGAIADLNKIINNRQPDQSSAGPRVQQNDDRGLMR